MILGNACCRVFTRAWERSISPNNLDNTLVSFSPSNNLQSAYRRLNRNTSLRIHVLN